LPDPKRIEACPSKLQNYCNIAMTTNDTKRDRALLTVLALLNIGSGFTTITGAQQVFPKHSAGLGILIGLAIQVILFMLLSRFAMREAPLRKWVGVTVFASLSVYTSFFTYYDALAQDSRTANNYDHALIAHQNLRASVYTPLSQKLAELQSQASFYEAQRKQEISGQGVSGEQGFGQEARSFAENTQKTQAEIAKLQPIINQLKSHFEYDTKDLKPEQILEKDRNALARVPKEHLPPQYKDNPQLNRADYIDETTSIRLLEPFRKIQNGEVPAKAALTIAMAVDGMIIMLGTAIEPRRRHAPFILPAHFISAIIVGLKSAFATVESAFHQERLPFSSPRPDETIGLREGVTLVTLRLKGRGSVFLEEFYNAINPSTGIVDYDRLQENANTTFAIGFRILLDALRNPRLRWIEIRDNKWQIVKEHYSTLAIWLSEEMVYQCELEEAQNKDNDSFYTAPHNVPIRLPADV
jgi:hypothetical protein